MAKEEAKRFIEDLAKPTGAQLRDDVKADAAVATAAKKRGYEFTGAELEEVLKEKWGEDYDKYVVLFCFSEAPGF